MIFSGDVTNSSKPTNYFTALGSGSDNGVPAPGAILTAKLDTQFGVIATYQWTKDGVNIAGQTNATYSVLDGDGGHLIGCIVTLQPLSGAAPAVAFPSPWAFPTGTNLLTTADFTNAFWSKNAITIANGTTNVLMETTANSKHEIFRTGIARVAGVKSFTAFADFTPVGNKNWFAFKIFDSTFAKQATAEYTLSNGRVFFSTSNGGFEGVAPNCVPVPGKPGTYRLSLGFITDALSTGLYFDFAFDNGDGIDTYAGVATQGIKIENPWLYEEDPTIPVVFNASLNNGAAYRRGSWYTTFADFGSGALVLGTDFTRTLAAVPASYPSKSTLQWNWPASPGSTVVKAAYSLSFGSYDGGGEPTTPITSKQLSAITSLTYGYDVTLGDGIANYNVLLDLFLTSAAGSGQAHTHELEIVAHPATLALPYYKGLTVLGSATISGVTWKFLRDPTNMPFLCAIKSDYSDLLVAPSIDIKAILQWFVTAGVVSNTEYFNGFGFIAEVIQGSGKITVNSLTATYT